MAAMQSKRWTVFRARYVSLLTAFGLAVVAFILAQWPPVHRGKIAGPGAVSIGLNLLIAGALPWLLQWASVALIFGSLTRHTKYLDLRTTIAVVMLPLMSLH